MIVNGGGFGTGEWKEKDDEGERERVLGSGMKG